MANNLGSRQDSDYLILLLFPSIELNVSSIPTPFPVYFNLGSAENVSENVNYNKCAAYIEGSDTNRVEGDKLGVLLGVVVKASMTAGTTFPGSPSSSVRVNGKGAHRQSDMQWMVIPADIGGLGTGKISELVSGALGDFIGADLSTMTTIGNTVGTLVKKSTPSAPAITIDGKIEHPNRDNIDIWEALGNATIGVGVGIMGAMGDIAASVASAVLGGDASGIPASNNPAVRNVPSGSLGSRTGSPVVLQTAQSLHTFSFYPLEGLLPLHLELFYINRAQRFGIFGFDRTCSYEKRFQKLDEQHYKLIHPDGRWFAFSYRASDDSYIDHGNLGVLVTQKEVQTFILQYRDGMIETYRYGLLTSIKHIQHPQNAITIGYIKHPRAGARIAEVKNTQGSALYFSYDDFGLVKHIQDHLDNAWDFAYDKEGYLLSLTYNDTPIEQYDYMDIKATVEDEHYLRTVYNAHKEPLLTFDYADHGSLSGYTQKEMSYTYQWSKDGSISKTDKEGKRHLFTLDDYGTIESIVYPDGTRDSCSYDRQTRTYKERTRGKNMRVRKLDVQHRILSESMNDEEVFSNRYEGDNPYPISHTTKEKTTTYCYDKNWHLSAVTHPDETCQSFTYTEEGLLLSQTDALGKETH
ncbi:MAG: YD repeat-containing protein [Sulfurovum sp.]|nr:YD repeat-containing protein [Sulfurovum sp.]